ncbi:MAG: glutamine synthetase III, partial [Clostridia bacterium]|nr:glutamine synthetase III [Clostridia bacterium]
MTNIPEIFGCMVFDDAVMKERLPKETYKAVTKSITNNTPLSLDVANVVANAMKDWAIEKGAKHYTHWFQPMTGITAEKHDSFISPSTEGKVIMEFSGKELIKGEPDASSFPNGGIRATFEARGYTNWDPTSYAFIKDSVLCIPTAFCAYTGVALDKKTPLLRSIDALNVQALRILRLFGNTSVKRVIPTVGPEQEYFLIDKERCEKRRDIMYTGRTLFGAKPPKGQDLDDHYFGAIKPRVQAFMTELDEELWKLGVLAKTEHNEVAPAQHEFAPIYTTTNIATDHNQLTMETMKKVAAKHNLVCLLHEKPFAGINGSGKHNNWALSTDKGKNLLDPGKTPSENAQFLLFLAASIKAVDDYQELMRISIASASNDLRLGGDEAPPAIVSIFLGDELTAILDAIENGTPYKNTDAADMEIGVSVLPHFPKDNTDRNRTSPFAFTGNKFEFRMLGSSASVASPNIVLNTIIAEALRQYADELEGAEDLSAAVSKLIKRTIKKHKRIIFNGDGYSKEWQEEAKKRGLLNLATTVDCMPHLISEKSVKLFTEHKVFTELELHSRYEIYLEQYSKVIKIEALTALDMLRKEIIPAVAAYIKDLAESAACKKSISPALSVKFEERIISQL